MKKFILTLVAASLLSLGAVRAAASETAPASVIHVVTVAWKATATPEQIQAAIDGVKALPAAYPGITHVWVKTLKIQNPKGTQKERTQVFVMEFKDAEAFKAYADSPAQKEWYKVYQPARDESTTHDITN